MEDILEIILTILFEKPIENLFDKIDNKYNKFFRVVIKTILFIIGVGIIALLCFVIRLFIVE